MSEGHLMHTVLVCYIFDKLGQACLCGLGTNCRKEMATNFSKQEGEIC